MYLLIHHYLCSLPPTEKNDWETFLIKLICQEKAILVLSVQHHNALAKLKGNQGESESRRGTLLHVRQMPRTFRPYAGQAYCG